VSLPLVFLVLDVYPLQRRGARARGLGWEKLPFLLLSGLFAAVAYRARSSFDVTTQARGLSSRVAQACYAIVYYPIKTVAPTALMPFHPIPSRTSLNVPLFQACAAGVVCLSILLFLLRRRWPGILAVWASYLVVLAPNSGIVSI